VEDYYKILGVPETASDAAIKSAYRKLAFKHHPDTNPGKEKEAEAKFKKINEAYCVLSNVLKRRQYDAARRGQFAGGPASSFSYSQQDIFRGSFSGGGVAEELERMFAQAGLRFDRGFINRVFFDGGGGVFYTSSGAGTGQWYQPAGKAGLDDYKPGLAEKAAAKVMGGLSKFVLRTLFGVKIQEPVIRERLDQHLNLEVSAAEAVSGAEKRVTYRHDKKKKRLLVKIPAGVKTGTKIRLRGMGQTKNGIAGDLYLHITVK
jgi:DnaJ-class molecular chaperone